MFRLLFAIFAGLIRSEDVASTITFVNEKDTAVEVFWVGPNGLEHVDRIERGGELQHETWLGHSFEVRLPGEESAHGALVGSWTIQWEDERIALRDEDANSAVTTISNRLDEPVNLYYNELLENGKYQAELIGTIQAGDDVFQQTWIGHQFLVKDTNGKILRTFTVDRQDTVVNIWAD